MHLLITQTGLDIWPLVAFHSPRNFTDPDEFIPERWIEGKNERFVNDKVQAFQPFSLGPRNCIGKKSVTLAPEFFICPSCKMLTYAAWHTSR
jgi:hypothetical protein